MQLSELNIYPVKSTRATSLQEAQLTPRGLEGDRRWMLITPQGRFITGREQPLLTQVVPILKGAALKLSACTMQDLVLPVLPVSAAIIEVEIWGQKVAATRVDARADAWFSEYLQQPCQLVYLADEQHRRVDPNYARDDDEVSFADGFPLLLISEASLQDLNSRLEKPVSMRCFRPNLVVSGQTNELAAFAEDHWRRIRIGELEFECVKACPRCIFTTIDPDTAERDERQEPLRTLGTYRRDATGGVNFGQNLIPRTLGKLRLGDAVEVLE